MTTLWQKWTGKKAVEPKPLYNPLNAKLGTSVSFNLIGLDKRSFFVDAIREVTRKIGSTELVSTDYDCATEHVIVRLRSNEGKLLLLEPYDPPIYGDWLPHNKQFHDVLKTSNELIMNAGLEDTETYWRVGSAEKGPTLPSVVAEIVTEKATIVSETLPPKLITKHRVTSAVETWDFSRMTDDTMGGQNEVREQVEQFLFVEMSTDSGEFQIYRGHEIDLGRVTIL